MKHRATSRPARESPIPQELRGLIEVEVGPAAHGGHCVARYEGRVIFVRHAIPGERVIVRVTGVGGGGKFLRADVTSVLVSAPERTAAPCPVASTCGGCDWQHVTLAGQRKIKSAIVGEALTRALGRPVEVDAQSVPGDLDGLGWRTRIRLSVDGNGHVGFHPPRSHKVVPIQACPISHPDLMIEQIAAAEWPSGSEVTVETDGAGARVLDDATSLKRRAIDRDWQVPAGGFWQVHPGAPDALAGAVRTAAAVAMGDTVIDLYAGVGLLGGSLASGVGPTGRILLVESGRAATAAAAANLADLTQCEVYPARVEQWLADAPSADVIVLDPPRAGAGRAVISRCATLAARTIVYVACDPMSLARDAATLAELGWELVGLEAFDLFPMTHHVECVARFAPYSEAVGSNS